MRKRFSAVLVLTGLLAWACDDQADPGIVAESCTPNQSDFCVCDNGQSGARKCGLDGRYGPCLCQPGGTGGVGGIAGQGGAGGIGGQGGAGGALDAGLADASTEEQVVDAGVDAGSDAVGDGGGDSGSDAGSGLTLPEEITMTVVAANTTVGLDWTEVDGATGYRVYWSTEPDVQIGIDPFFEVSDPSFVHRGLENGVIHYYVITAITVDGESVRSNESPATPDGEWALESLGTGLFDDIITGGHVARVPLDRRVHLLLFAEGYTEADLGVFHNETSHESDRSADVDSWVDEVFALEPYGFFPEAFVIWYLPRASAEHIGGDTAFAVPVDLSGSFPGTQSIPTDGVTASRAWEAMAAHPFPPLYFSGSYGSRALNHVAYFLMFDPNRGRASVSGRATSLQNPDNSSQRIGAAFGVPFAHEFTHSFSRVADEYLEDDSSAPSSTSETSNVVATNTCDQLPWSHLLVGGAINPDTDQLVGAFGTDQHGYHAELLCLMNGTHDNATYYGGDGSLRTDDRMCNFCREITAYRVFERTQVISGSSGLFEIWKSDYRTAFYDRFGFVVPPVVPQTNDVRNPDQGDPIYEACVP
jgi:hypothetical protein